MNAKRILGTTSFRVRPEDFGCVYGYRSNADFDELWQAMFSMMTSKNKNFRMPISSLTNALCLESKGFCRWNPQGRKARQYILLSDTILDPATVKCILFGWATVYGFPKARELATAWGDAQPGQLAIADFFAENGGRFDMVPDGGWVWDAGYWAISKRLAKSPLVLAHGREVTFRPDIQGSLVTWDDPISITSGKGAYQALHKIEIRLITVPGISDPVVTLVPRISRISFHWGQFTNHAWMDVGEDQPLLRLAIAWNRINGDWKCRWNDKLVDVLRTSSITPIQEAGDIDLKNSKTTRAFLGKNVSWHPLGTGVGPYFSTDVAKHMEVCLPNSEQITFSKSKGRLPRPNVAEKMMEDDFEEFCAWSGKQKIEILCIYTKESVRKRVLQELKKIVDVTDEAWGAQDDVEYVWGNRLVVRFLSPRGIGQVLIEPRKSAEVTEWLDTHLLPLIYKDNAKVTGCFVETFFGEDLNKKEADKDTKHSIKKWLASQGLVSQFIREPKEKKGRGKKKEENQADHPAIRAVWDLFRSLGCFGIPFPKMEGTEKPVSYVGCHVVRKNGQRGPKKFLVSLVAVESGGKKCLGYCKGEWLIYPEMVASTIANNSLMHKDDVKRYVESALQKLLTQDPFANMILYMDATGCRRFWSGLCETGGRDSLPMQNNERVAVVRLRNSAQEIPRIAHKGILDEPNPGGVSNALYTLSTDMRPNTCYYVSSSKTRNQIGDHRHHDRFTASSQSLRKNWHGLGCTEIQCCEVGPFERESIVSLTAKLCRESPAWEGTLRMPWVIQSIE